MKTDQGARIGSIIRICKKGEKINLGLFVPWMTKEEIVKLHQAQESGATLKTILHRSGKMLVEIHE